VIFPALRSLDSSEPGLELRSGPRDPENFNLWIEANIGPADGPGEEVFGFYVRTPRWLAEQVTDDRYVWEPGLVIECWSATLVEETVRKICRRCHGDDWGAVARKLSRYMSWEFADYVPDRTI
jgi:hypothetical protein